MGADADVVYDHNMMMFKDRNTGELRQRIEEFWEQEDKTKIVHSGLWPLYMVNVVPSLADFRALGGVIPATKYILGKRKLIAELVRLKLRYPKSEVVKVR